MEENSFRTGGDFCLHRLATVDASFLSIRTQSSGYSGVQCNVSSDPSPTTCFYWESSCNATEQTFLTRISRTTAAWWRPLVLAAWERWAASGPTCPQTAGTPCSARKTCGKGGGKSNITAQKWENTGWEWEKEFAEEMHRTEFFLDDIDLKSLRVWPADFYFNASVRF